MKVFIGLIFISVTSLSVAEYFASVWLKNYGDPFTKARQLLVPNDSWGWQLRPNIDRNFFGARVVTNSQGIRDKAREIWSQSHSQSIVLGPSSAFGWGVEANQAYAKVLQNLLNKTESHYVVNASQVGFTVDQGLNYYKGLNLNKFKWDYFVIAYGINELDRFPFFSSHKNLKVQELFSRWALPNLIAKALYSFQSSYFCQAAAKRNTVPLKPRLSLAGYLKATQELIDLGKQSAKQIVLVGTPFQLKKDGMAPEKTYDEYYYLWAIEQQKGNCKKAQEYFAQAMSAEVFRINESVNQYNNGLENLAQENQALFVDSWSLLRDIGAKAFFDPVHPSVFGHEVIANEIYRAIKALESQ